MSDGLPKFATSSGRISVSNVVANEAYSALVNPPVGLDVSARTMALPETAATRAITLIGFVQLSSPLALSVTSDPIAGFAGTREYNGRWRYHACAAGIRGSSSRRADACSRCSNAVCTALLRRLGIFSIELSLNEGVAEGVDNPTAPFAVTPI